jgi:phage protein D
MENETVAGVVAPLMDLGALAEFAGKPSYSSYSTAKKLYEHTVEEARELVKVRDQNKVKRGNLVSLGINLGRCLLPLDKIKAKATRLVVSDEAQDGIAEALLAHVAAGAFDEEIAIALAQTKATAEKMADAVNKKNDVDASVAVDDSEIGGLDLEALSMKDTVKDIEQL